MRTSFADGQFGVGDRVRVLLDDLPWFTNGEVGIVVEVSEDVPMLPMEVPLKFDRSNAIIWVMPHEITLEE